MVVASLAQVHPAALPDGREVVVIVQRPGICSVIETDLELLSILVTLAQLTRWGQVYDFVSLANNFAFLLNNKLDYCREGQNADRFRKNFEAESHLYIPHVYCDLSSQYMMVLERIQRE